MGNEKVYEMPFGKIYGALVHKALRKNRTIDEVNEIISWLTGYEPAALDALAASDLTYGDFFRKRSALQPIAARVGRRSGTVHALRLSLLSRYGGSKARERLMERTWA